MRLGFDPWMSGDFNCDETQDNPNQRFKLSKIQSSRNGRYNMLASR